MYIDKEQRYGGAGDAEIASEERRGNGEVWRGWICRNRMGGGWRGSEIGAGDAEIAWEEATAGERGWRVW